MLEIVYDREWSNAGTEIDEEDSPRWLDIETRKIEPGKEPYSRGADPNYPYRYRWSVFMAGIAGASEPGVFFVTVAAGNEFEICSWIRETCEDTEVRYSATRDFDEMVLRGRFTNARRATLDRPAWVPNLDGVPIEWRNLRKIELPRTWERAEDVLSRDVPGVWAIGGKENRNRVALHCARDVAENVLRDPSSGLSKRLRRSLLALVSA